MRSHCQVKSMLSEVYPAMDPDDHMARHYSDLQSSAKGASELDRGSALHSTENEMHMLPNMIL